MEKDDKQMKFITVQLEADLKDRFEKKIIEEERSISSAVRFLIKQYLGEDD